MFSVDFVVVVYSLCSQADDCKSKTRKSHQIIMVIESSTVNILMGDTFRLTWIILMCVCVFMSRHCLTIYKFIVEMTCVWCLIECLIGVEALRFSFPTKSKLLEWTKNRSNLICLCVECNMLRSLSCCKKRKEEKKLIETINSFGAIIFFSHFISIAMSVCVCVHNMKCYNYNVRMPF